MIQILVVEDNFLVAESLCEDIRAVGFEVCAVAESGEMAMNEVSKNPPDLILMDIRIKGEMDGIETATKLIQDYEIPIIFLTDQTDQFTFNRAKKVQPHAFLSKPVTAVSLQRSIELALNTFQKKYSKTKNNQSLEEGRVFKKHFMLKAKGGLYTIDLNEIECLMADTSYCRLKTTEKEYHISKPMNTVLESLQVAPYCKENVIRISKSASINIQKVQAIKGNKVLLGEKEFSIGARYREVLFEKIQTL
ncbi:MAG: response regulator [Vicingaceae bacterium]